MHVACVGRALETRTESIAARLRAFRGAYDGAFCAPDFESEVTAQYVALCRDATTYEHVQDLKGALFNLRFKDASQALIALAACGATADVLPAQDRGLEWFMPHAHGYADPVFRLLGVAFAFAQLEEWGRKPSKRFYDWASFMLHSTLPRAELESKLCSAVDAVFQRFYAKGLTTYEHPLDPADRLARSRPLPVGARTATRIYADLVSMLPKVTPRPYQP